MHCDIIIDTMEKNRIVGDGQNGLKTISPITIVIVNIFQLELEKSMLSSDRMVTSVGEFINMVLMLVKVVAVAVELTELVL